MADLAAKMIEALTSRTINDITYEQMGRIVRRVRYMSREVRGEAKRVADVLAEEIGPEKALEYVEKALAGGLITRRQYDEMRAALIFPLPRERIPAPWAGAGGAELLAVQRRLQGEFRDLTDKGRQAFERPMRLLNKDVERIRKVWGR